MNSLLINANKALLSAREEDKKQMEALKKEIEELRKHQVSEALNPAAFKRSKTKSDKKTGTLSWTEYCECEMLRHAEENENLKMQMDTLRRCLQSQSGTTEKQIKLAFNLKKELDELKEATCDYSYLSQKYDEHRQEIEELKKELAELKAKEN